MYHGIKYFFCNLLVCLGLFLFFTPLIHATTPDKELEPRSQVIQEADPGKAGQYTPEEQAFIETETFKGAGTQTASFGVTEFKKGDDTQAMISRADKALYLAKSNGRNQVESML